MRPLLPAVLLLAACAQETPTAPEKKPVTAVPAASAAATVEPAVTDRLVLSDQEWRQRLTPEQFTVLRQQGTERPFCGGYTASKDHGPGTYRCAGCGNPLFDGGQKFESGTGWPSFWHCFKGRVALKRDASHGMERTEVVCARCDGHLGHLFDDGPAPTGARFCINAVSLRFDPWIPPTRPPGARMAVFAAGCFWGVEAHFRSLPGVVDARVGYIGGRTNAPTYEQVCSHGTGHAEAVEVVYDPAITSYERLLDAFFQGHDPTTVDRQGPDVGDQYRSAVFPADSAEQAAFQAAVTRWQPRFKAPIVTRSEPPATFWPAEEYHQRYQAKRGLGIGCH
ncbi:MAG: bifunctional methionine sulfoxide reductase B/A protein [Planctomycetes bacterium]|nr:bifunctional methionine sulfoxide reductase B/A protein [Planctomycetota bacterium]